MSHRPRISVETLETRALQSGFSHGLVGSVDVGPKIAPAGTIITLTFTEKNVSNHEISVTRGPIDEGFTASQGGKTVWISNGGIEPQYLELDRLEPGQSITVTATWDGHASGTLSQGEGPAVYGKFTISNELDPQVRSSVTIRPEVIHPIIDPLPRANRLS